MDGSKLIQTSIPSKANLKFKLGAQHLGEPSSGNP